MKFLPGIQDIHQIMADPLHFLGRILAEPIFIYLYTCMESAEMIAPFSFFANAIDNSVFPAAVGPVRTIKGFFNSFTYTIRLNFFSISCLEMEMIVGRP